MRISLAGPSYTSGSVNAACEQTMNLVPELIEAPGEPVRMVLYGRPGLKHFSNVVPTKVRGLWAGGGRLFIVHGNTLSEVTSAGGVTPRTGTIAELGTDPDPAQMFSNGHQLMVVAGHKVYVDNGAGPVVAKFALGGTGNTVTSTASLNYLSGDTPVAGWVGQLIRINNRVYTITGLITTPSIMVQLSPAPPNENGVRYLIAMGADLDGVTGGFLDGYFIVNRVPNPTAPSATDDPGRQFNISALNDGTIWDPLMYAVKEGHSDYINSILCDHEQLILFGTETTEIWQNTGNADFPFQRIPGAYIQDGTVAVYAPCSVGTTFYWLGGGSDGQTRAYRANGFRPERISTHAQEWTWNTPDFRVRDAVSYSYINAGHLYWVVSFWQQNKCWVFDVNTSLWHEWGLWDAANSRFLLQKAYYHAFVPEWGDGGKHIVGDPKTGNLYEMSASFYDDDGTAMQCQRAFPHLINENQYAYHSRLEVLVEMGALGVTDPLPQLGLDWSDDHGHTFAHGRLKNMAASGNYTQRMAWRRLGKARDRVYRVGVNGHTKVALIDTYLEATAGFA